MHIMILDDILYVLDEEGDELVIEQVGSTALRRVPIDPALEAVEKLLERG